MQSFNSGTDRAREPVTWREPGPVRWGDLWAVERSHRWRLLRGVNDPRRCVDCGDDNLSEPRVCPERGGGYTHASPPHSRV